jgi:PadR family transcriptional regulator, regulatory protein PadR
MDAFRLSGKERLILKMLIEHRRELYGLEMVEQSGGDLARGTVYVTLARMEDKGFVTSRREESATAPGAIPRRLYRISGLGERTLAAVESIALDRSLSLGGAR